MSELLFNFHNTKPSRNGKGPRSIILDMDECVIHSYENPQFLDALEIYINPSTYRLLHPLGSQSLSYSMLLDINGNQSRIWGMYRPHLFEFLAFAGEYFDNIIVWSAGIVPYVEEIVKQMFLESGLRPPKLVWARNRCAEYKGLFHKPISEIEAELATRPYQTFTLDPKTTLIIDDKQHTFMSNPNNGVLIPVYSPGKENKGRIPTLNNLLDRSDDCLLKFMSWLQRPEVMNCEDIRLLDKTHIFD